MNLKKNSISKKFILTALTMTCWIFTFGGALSRDYPSLNDASHMIYRACEPSDAYLKQNVVIAGTVTSATDAKHVQIKTAGGGNIKVTASSNLSLAGLSKDDTVRLYGTLAKNRDSSAAYSLKADHAEKGVSMELKDDYYVFGGKSYNVSDTMPRTVAVGDISYRIPRRWSDCMASPDEKAEIFNIGDIGAADCYFLNSIDGGNDTECFMIFDFDYSRHLYDSDTDRVPGIEKAIVNNICPDHFRSFFKGIMFNPSSAVASFDISPDYYIASYDNSYDAEFVFVPGKESMCVALYVYNGEPRFLDDVLYVIRSLDPV